MADDLVAKLHNTAIRAAQTREYKRLRLAVTPAEYDQIRQHCFERDGKFFARLANIPLVIENDPENPPLRFEQHGVAHSK